MNAAGIPPAALDWRGVAGRTALLGLLGATLWWVMHLEYTVCPFANLTGHPCPGCGMTRAALHLLRGNVGAAVSLHPLSLICAPVAAAVMLEAARRFVLGRAAHPLLWLSALAPRVTELFWWILAAALVLVWMARFGGWLGGPVSVESVLTPW